MAEQKTNMTDEQLAQELCKSKGGKLGGKILSLLGGVIAVAGMILGGNLVLVVIGGVVLGLGQMVQGKSKEQAGRQTFDSIAPDIVGTTFENIQMNPVPPLRMVTMASSTSIIMRNLSRPDHGAVYRPADGSQRVSAGGDRPVGKERAGGLHRPVDAVPAEPGISHMADHLAAGQTG